MGGLSAAHPHFNGHLAAGKQPAAPGRSPEAFSPSGVEEKRDASDTPFPHTTHKDVIPAHTSPGTQFSSTSVDRAGNTSLTPYVPCREWA